LFDNLTLCCYIRDEEIVYVKWIDGTLLSIAYRNKKLPLTPWKSVYRQP
jgi:hypothetical protein